MLVALCGVPAARAQRFAVTVSAPVAPPVRDDAMAVSVIEVGLPGQPGAPSAARVSLAEALRGQVGTQVRSTGGLGQFSGALLRGSSSSQVAVLLDGVPLNRGGQSTIDLSQLSIDGVQRIEVYRGATPLDLGVDAVGGAINLISRRGQGARTGWATLGSGSFGLRKLSAGYSDGRGPLRVAATASYQGATGDFPFYYTGGRVYDRAALGELRRRGDGFEQVSVDARVSRDLAAGGFFVQASGLLKRQGVADIGQPTAQTEERSLDLGRALLLAGGNRLLADGRAELTGDAHVLVERSLYRALAREPAALFEQLGRQAGGRVLLRVRSRPADPAQPAAEREEHTLVALADLRYEHQTSTDLCPAPRRDCAGAGPLTSQRLRALLGLGGELHIDGDRLLVQPGLHLLVARDDFLQDPRGVEAALLPPSVSVFPAPRVLARLRLSEWLLLRASTGRFVRLPTFLELFGDSAFFRGNPSLKPESAWTFELGARAATPHALRDWVQLSIEVHGFGRQVEDLIDVVRDGPTLRARNVGAALAAGLEVEAKAQLREALSATMNYTLLSARDQTHTPGRDGNQLPGRPPHALFARLDAGWHGWRLFYEVEWTALTYLDPANLQPRPARALHAVGAQLGLLGDGSRPGGSPRLSLAIEIRNLLDTRLIDVVLPLSSDQRPTPVPLGDVFDYPLPGRALYATLSARL